MYSLRVQDLLYSETLSEAEKRAAARRFYGTALAITHSFDLLCAFLLLASSCDWRNVRECMLEEIDHKDGYVMKTGSAICFAMAVSRLFLFPLLSFLAIHFGVESAHLKSTVSKIKPTSSGNSLSTSTGDETNTDELRVRLLVHEVEITDEKDLKENSHLKALAEESFDHLKAKRRGQFVKYTFLTLIFICSTLYQVFSGVKVSSYQWKHERNTEILMICLSVLWINLLAYFYRTLIDDETTEEGLYLREVHKHPLYWRTGFFSHRCDLCRTEIKNSQGAVFRCKLCDFDCCIACAKRDDLKDVSENLVRTDKGVRTSEKDTLSNATYFKRAMSIAKPEWPLLTISLTCLITTCITNLALPNMWGKIVNDIVATDQHSFLGHVTTYLFIMISQGLLNGVSNFLFVMVSRKLSFNVRNKLFSSVIKQDVAFFDGTTSGHVISKLTNDVLYMMYPVRSSLSSLIQNVILLLGGVFMCYVTSYKLSLMAFVTVGPIMFLWDLYGDFSKRLNRKMLVAWENANSSANEALNHIRDVKAFCNEEHESNTFVDINKVALKAGITDAIASGLTQTVSGYLDLGTGVLIMWFGGLLVFDNSITIGELVAFQSFWVIMNNAYQSLQGLLVQFTQSAAAAEKVFSLWDNVPDIEDNFESKPVDWKVSGKLELKNVMFYYQMRPENIVLKNLNLKIEAGSVCAFVGRSGGGKSSLIKLLLRFYDPRSGSIYLDDREYTTLKVSELRKQFACVAQNTTLFAKSIKYNLTYGLSESEFDEEKMIDACKKAQCYDFIMEFKDKFETRCGESGGRVSGGQAQRIALARMFLRNPKIVLLDEATSALDEESQSKVQESLDIFLKEHSCTIVLVAHRLSTVQFADKIAVIDKGVVLEEGSHEQLMELENGIYNKLVNLKISKDRSLYENEKNGQKENGKNKNVGKDDVESMMEKIMQERAAKEQGEKVQEEEASSEDSNTK